MTTKEGLILTAASLLIVGAAFAQNVHSAVPVASLSAESPYSATIQQHEAAFDMLNQTDECPR